MLNCAEELILLAIDDLTGAFHRVTSINFNLALVGALVMDLGLRRRIDADEDHIFIVDKTPTGDPFLDHIMSLLCCPEASQDTNTLLRQLYNSLDSLKEHLLQSLEQKGIIRYSESKVLWLFKQRRYPVLDNSEEVEVLTRIRRIVVANTEPEARDIAMIYLLYTCDLMDKIFSREELNEYQSRIETIQDKELIGHAVNRIIGEVQAMISSTYIA